MLHFVELMLDSEHGQRRHNDITLVGFEHDPDNLESDVAQGERIAIAVHDIWEGHHVGFEGGGKILSASSGQRSRSLQFHFHD